MRQRAGLSLLVALALGATGCWKATFIRDPEAIKGTEHDQWVSFFVFGLVGEKTFDVKQFCPDGRIAVVRTGGNFGTGLVSALTIGIYTPRKVYVTCAGESRASLELFGDSEGRLVAAVRQADDVRQLGRVSAGAQPGAWKVTFEEVVP
jgi:hypothetical protein